MALMRQEFYYESFPGLLLGNKARAKEILKILEEMKKKETLLEVGCAQGYFIKKMQDRGIKAVGMDFKFSNAIEAKGNANKSEFVGGDAQSIPFVDNSFDWVLCSEVLEHVPDWKKALSEIQRVAKRHIVITVPMEHGYIWRAISIISPMEKRDHLHKITIKDISNQMNGWKLERDLLMTFPSSRMNRALKNKMGEKGSLYALMHFVKSHAE